MTRKTYCGNLLWQSGLTLLAPLQFEIDRYTADWEEAATELEALTATSGSKLGG